MAGQPRWNAFLLKMEELGDIDYICERVIAGETIKTIAHGLGTSSATIYRFIHLGENHAVYREARRLAADALVEEGQDIIDNVSTGGEAPSADVAKAKARADYRRWRAGSDNREVYGPPQPAAAVQINLGSDFLGALRELGGPGERAQITAGDVVDVDSVKEEARRLIEGE